ncbi:glycosyltransferase involved in cell wall biosynthesis [Lachnospiraceae bacterium PF1-22]|uniref:glycosyltransferase n=1 Tax=Ohessyouella blattaphilus TaxID=2949333 RepID=UPI003E219B49
MMKIFLLAPANSIHTVKWVNSFAERGHQVLLSFIRGHEPDKNKLSERVVLRPLKHRGFIGYYWNAHELKCVVEEFKPDVINVHYGSGYGTLARLARLPNIILSVWGSDVYDFPYKSRVHATILKRNVRYAYALASTSECMANQLRRVIKDDDLEITITPFGIDLRKFNPSLVKRTSSNGFVIGCIKTLKEVYRIEDLIKAFALLKTKCKEDIRLEIYGNGELEEELKMLVQKLALGNSVEINKAIPNTEVPQVLANMDVFCVTSAQESFGVAVLESMAMGLPTVVTDAEGFVEVTQNNLTSIVVPKKNVEKIADALYQLVNDVDLRRRLGQAGRTHVVANYDWERCVDVMIDLYRKVSNLG